MTLFVGDQEKDRLQPDPDQIFELVYSGWRAHILITAIQLDVFTIVADGLCTVEKIASARNWSRKPTRVLLDGLCPLFLSKKDGEYSLTPTSEAFLVRNRKTYAGDSIRHFFRAIHGNNLPDISGLGYRKFQKPVPPSSVPSGNKTLPWNPCGCHELMKVSKCGGQ